MSATSILSLLKTDPHARRDCYWAMGLSVALFVLFKLLYPYPDFFSDSYSYIVAADAHLDINIWPIGYSKFLLLVHGLTHSAMALVAIQYFLMQLSFLYFFLSIRSLLLLTPQSQKLILIFLFANPLTLYLCNTVNSDALFGALSILWLTELIWMLYSPRLYRVFTHGILLFLCFSVRNNAYFYPFIALIAILLTHQRLWRKLAFILLPVLMIVLFIRWTENAAFKLTGTRQFSLFTGWQLANNALYIYDQIEVDSSDLPTPQAKVIDRLARNYFNRVRLDIYQDFLDSYVGNYFIRETESPLKQYYVRRYRSDGGLGQIITWARASAEFEPFGKYIILNHPVAYLHYFALPNFWRYIMPPLSHLEQYNYGQSEISPVAADWFDFPQNKVHCVSFGFQGFLLIYTAIFLLINAYFAWKIISYFVSWYIADQRQPIPGILWLCMSFIALNLAFSLVSTVNILRYQYIPMVVILLTDLLLADYLLAAKQARQQSISAEIKPAFTNITLKQQA